MSAVRLAAVAVVLAAGACLPNAIVHYAATLTQVATCEIHAGTVDCQPPADGGVILGGTLSVDEREDRTRVFFRDETMLGTFDGDTLKVSDTRDLIREASGCMTRQHRELDGIVDNPGFGIRRELTGEFRESTTAEGDPQQCGVNVPYGELRRFRVEAVEVSQP
ncbi:MAG: hypothetical protein HY904_26125 [Deltaproteobacteria bacterium]|nr:hypothetical protein [Deltaproteobacteria bacterium]